MAFDSAVFWPAFRAAGFLKTAAWSGGPDFDVRFEQPQRLDPQVGVHTTDYMIEFQAADAPGLAAESHLTIGGVVYEVLHPPQLQGDGYFAIAFLEKRP